MITDKWSDVLVTCVKKRLREARTTFFKYLYKMRKQPLGLFKKNNMFETTRNKIAPLLANKNCQLLWIF